MDKDYMRKQLKSDRGSYRSGPLKPASAKGFRDQRLECLPVLRLR
jgi:hypothetical protein